MNQKFYQFLPSLSHEEAQMLHAVAGNLEDAELQNFISVYNGKRQNPDTILLVTILGFVVVAGIQRFLLKQIGMGLLYLFTGGLCLIGTIVDLVNYKKLTLDFNTQAAYESLQIAKTLR